MSNTVLFLFPILLICAASCANISATSDSPGVPPAPYAGDALPALETLDAAGLGHAVSADTQSELAGSSVWLLGPGSVVEAETSTVLLTHEGEQLSWCIYRFADLHNAHSPRSLSLTLDAGDGLSPAIGLAYSDFGRGRWRVLYQAAPQAELTFDLYHGLDIVSPGNNAYVAVLLYSAGTARIAHVGLSITSDSFVHSWGTSGADRLNDIAADAQGNIYAVGQAGSAQQALVLKYSADGVLAWARSWSWTEGAASELGALAIDAAGILYCAGYATRPLESQRDFLLISVSPDGDLRWQNTWGGEDEDSAADLQVSAGVLHVVGSTESYGGGAVDGALLKIGDDGHIIGLRAWGSGGSEAFNAVALREEPHLLVVAGYADREPGQPADTLLLGYDNTGAVPLAARWGGSAHDELTELVLDSAGDVYACGRQHSFTAAADSDALLLRYDAEFNLLWARDWGSADADELYGLALTAAGDVIAAGAVGGPSPGAASAALMLTFDYGGQLTRGELWHGSGADSFAACSIGPAAVQLFCGSAPQVANADGLRYWRWQPLPAATLEAPIADTAVPAFASSIPVGGYHAAFGTLSDIAAVIDTGGGDSDALVILREPAQ